MKFVEGQKPPRSLSLRPGHRLRFEFTGQDAGIRVKIKAVFPGGRVVDLDQKDCSSEFGAWRVLAEFAADRMCDAADREETCRSGA